MHHFYKLSDFRKDVIHELLEIAARLERNPEPTALSGKVMALLFLDSSLRTLVSFQASMARLGGGTFVISPDMSIHGLESRSGIVMDGKAAEHIQEAVPVIASYADVIGIRLFAHRRNLADDLADTEYKALCDLTGVPVINMESAISHPCQALADWKTLNDQNVPGRGGKLVISWVFHPNALPLAVTASTLEMAAMRGMDVTVLRPDGFALPEAVIRNAKALAETHGGSVSETSQRNEAMEGAHIVYAKSWSATGVYGNKNADDELRREALDWRMDSNWMANSRPDSKFMHCLPVRRGVEVVDELLESEHSIIIQQAQNRMWAQMGLLYKMLR